MCDISVAIFLWGEFFFATCFRQIIFCCAKNIFSSHLAIGSANPDSYQDQVSGECLQDHWSSSLSIDLRQNFEILSVGRWGGVYQNKTMKKIWFTK